MEVRLGSLVRDAQEARGTAIIIDVFRAFTTAAIAFDHGVKEITLVAEPEEALQLHRKGVGDYLVTAKAAAVDSGASQDARVFDSAQFLADRMQDVPVHVIPCIEAGHIPTDAPRRAWIGLGGSIFPAIWSFQLALRARGLGSCLTTLHLSYEKEVSAMLGIPDSMVQIALLPVAYTKGTDFKLAKRPPAEDIIHWENW